MMLLAGTGCFLAAVIAAGYWKRKYRRLYCGIDFMLEEILEQKKISLSDVREGELSALSGKARRIQEVFRLKTEEAGREKEQVKQMISNMSHQLKTPLANIMMYEEILENEELPAEQRNRFFQKLRSQSLKIDWILQSLFKMVKLEQNMAGFDLEEADVKETIMDAVGAVYEKAEKKRIQMEVDMEKAGNKKLLHNRKWTAEVFENILENAIKYSDENTQIRIVVNPMEMYTAVSFSDQGIGIASSEFQDIFRRFYRSPMVRDREGAGIGLCLSKMILEKEKGYLTVESKLGKGSCFTVYLQNGTITKL